ncbi:MAG: acyltransferase [bacterium]|nr:acyltransferase [bacterium]
MIESNVKLGKNVKVYHSELVNLYDCEIGSGCTIGAFVEIGKGAKIGKRVKIQAFAFIPEGVTIEDGVFIGPHVCFTNDKYPRATNRDWKVVRTLVCKGASIGANSTIVCGVTIGEGAMVGAGSVVTRDVPPRTIVVGNPAKVSREIKK